MDDWQREALAQVEKVAYSTTMPDLYRVLLAVGDLVHHVIGHTEEEWRDHIGRAACTTCSGIWTEPRA